MWAKELSQREGTYIFELKILSMCIFTHKKTFFLKHRFSKVSGLNLAPSMRETWIEEEQYPKRSRNYDILQ